MSRQEKGGGQFVVPLASDYPNRLVTRTLTKADNLAGFRVR